MKNTPVLIVLAAALAGAGGYWWGQRGHPPAASGATAAGPAGAASAPARKLLYYRNPMGLPDTSPTPKKDPMGMDYIPVYEGEEAGGGANPAILKLSVEKVQKLGVRTEVATQRPLQRALRAAGRVEVDERRMHAVAPKFEGWVERLHVNATGQAVRRGEPLFEVYSPELVSAQREYQLAVQGVQALKEAGGAAQAGMQQLADAALVRLRNWDISEEQLQALVRGAEPRRTLTLRAPAAGVVMTKKALTGMRFMPGETLYEIADLSAVWVLAEVYEQDLALLRTGARARVRLDAYPERSFEGRVAYVYPTLKAETRTVPVRIELSNPGALLKPAMYAQVELQAPGRAAAVTVPLSAVIDSGRRRIVLVELGEGRFEPREVRLGARSEQHVEVLEGVGDGERVVVAANFLIDAESNLKAAVAGFAPPSAASAPTAAPKTAGHQGEGKVDAIDARAGTISLAHGPIASLKWPAMTMEFKLANPSLAQGLKPGASVAFEFVERQPGEWVVTRLKPLAAAAGHAGH